MPQFPSVEFLTSSWQPRQFPADVGAEVAFAGRSNAGKSSALNAITGRKDLARTSKTPGRTQLINFFALNEQQRLADLPGYGYAKVPEKMRDHWRQLMERYVETRASLGGVVIVMDSRHPLTEFDWQMLEWTGAQNLPVHLLLTKADKLGRGESMATLKKVRSTVGEGVTAQLFSAVSKAGVDEARKEVLKMLATRLSHGPVDNASG
ncbi:YihA family ribosome biogenesis GTP-binding protein [Steroidobacter sp. S1-65]|uniref:Probable GTP-binding protein EngB n=1 Tax=Steroidobacter gossypii TaxID=2805490 RepID=A0ABS1WSK9_9GAMM|nr:ribosome biogenesis GTP-binding protein YihA/YsxC [Steroidobacter gossypii]MBM0103941.1 YihA family ribosome biogenesis GTP-binding protein [Steroidobacter gossypii]